ncbi:MAG: alpha/beta hydrolase [Leptothrix sp. (in: b-proteobacteria)]
MSDASTGDPRAGPLQAGPHPLAEPPAVPGERGVLLFSHANGFPAGCYRQLFEVWRAAGWRVEAVPLFGHDPRWPVTGNWIRLRDELIHHADALRPAGPLVLVGHSMGGYLSLMAACKRPDLARAVVLLDSPLVGGWRAHGVQVAKATRLMPRVSPGKVSARRRQHWPSAADCLAHYATKHVFARWAPGVLADYIDAGTEPAPEGGVRLCFRREVETRIYNTLPHHLPALLRRQPPRCPVHFIGGTQSVEVRQVGLGLTRQVTHGVIDWIDGSHLYPMERPAEAAAAVLAHLNPASSRAGTGCLHCEPT